MIKKYLFLFCFMVFEIFYSQKQIITGKVVNEDNVSLASVTVINISTNEKIQSNYLGEFSIEASKNDELRFVKAGYDRATKKITDDVSSSLLVILTKLPEEISEVKVFKKSPGGLSDGEKVRQSVGLPQPTGKMREKPTEVKEVLIPILLGQLNIQGVYDLVSGKARRQKRQYRYDDLQEDIAWVKSRLDDSYFTEKGIPKERISEFIEFTFSSNPQIRTFVRARNLTAALFRIEELVPVYVNRLNKKEP
ncbi:carboxypeptidase regulatory-like domain-containing protein [Chryseobacterium sp. MMS23-Vi53]|uniref:carboxypeptidase regulatory-like domain-containing protein n=1 Tax=Chryseobacterium sp. MMS23-Vi53 TaxID=3386644 RepID=UPI0039E7A956